MLPVSALGSHRQDAVHSVDQHVVRFVDDHHMVLLHLEDAIRSSHHMLDDDVVPDVVQHMLMNLLVLHHELLSIEDDGELLVALVGEHEYDC